MQGLGQVEDALLPLSGTFTMDVEGAVEAAFIINPSIIIPMHIRNADSEHLKKKLKKMVILR